jgi:hypothetical protein
MKHPIKLYKVEDIVQLLKRDVEQGAAAKNQTSESVPSSSSATVGARPYDPNDNPSDPYHGLSPHKMISKTKAIHTFRIRKEELEKLSHVPMPNPYSYKHPIKLYTVDDIVKAIRNRPEAVKRSYTRQSSKTQFVDDDGSQVPSGDSQNPNTPGEGLSVGSFWDELEDREGERALKLHSALQSLGASYPHVGAELAPFSPNHTQCHRLALAEGFVRGDRLGHDDGIMENVVDSIVKSYKDETKKAYKLALEMMKRGIDLDQIALVMGMDRDDLDQLVDLASPKNLDGAGSKGDVFVVKYGLFEVLGERVSIVRMLNQMIVFECLHGKILHSAQEAADAICMNSAVAMQLEKELQTRIQVYGSTNDIGLLSESDVQERNVEVYEALKSSFGDQLLKVGCMFDKSSKGPSLEGTHS